MQSKRQLYFTTHKENQESFQFATIWRDLYFKLKCSLNQTGAGVSLRWVE